MLRLNNGSCTIRNLHQEVLGIELQSSGYSVLFGKSKIKNETQLSLPEPFAVVVMPQVAE